MKLCYYANYVNYMNYVNYENYLNCENKFSKVVFEPLSLIDFENI